MIRTTGTFQYRNDKTGFGEHWRERADEILVSCDEPGCEVTAVPSGLEYNGPTVECIYGMKGWHMEQKDLCPEHAPSLDHDFEPSEYPDECAECGECWLHDIHGEGIA